MSSLCGTARLSRVDLRWLHCFSPLSHAVFVQDCQYIVCWMQDLGLWAFLMFWSACCCIFVFSNCSHISFVIFQVFKGMSVYFKGCPLKRSRRLRKSTEGLPLRPSKAKAPSTTERYSSDFQTFREWSSRFEEVACLPSDETSVAPYLEYFAAAEFPLLHTWVCLLWHKLAHHRYGFPICDLTWSVLEAVKIELAKPVSIKREALLLPRWFWGYIIGLRTPRLILLIFA